MQITHGRWSVNNLLSIFDTSSTVLYEHLNRGVLKQSLLKNHHIVKDGRSTIFDDYAVLKLAQTFSTRTVKKRHKKQKPTRIGKRTLKQLISLTRKNSRELDYISNKLGMKF